MRKDGRRVCLSLVAGLILAACQQGSDDPARAGDQAADAGPVADNRPNILLLVADDLGYSDLGSYGGEIATPRLDELARAGIRFSDFSVAVTCSTTRSMLLTGVDNHLNGLGGLDEAGRPRRDGARGYEGHLNDDVVTIASLLQDAGYHTYMAGKWHLGRDLATGPENRGFESVFVTPGGAASHFSMQSVISTAQKATYRENGEPAEPPAGFYSSAFFTDKLIEYIDANAGDGRPFFVYAAYTAPHWPLQAPDDYIEGYDGVYDAGYDAIRAARLERLAALGFPAAASGPPPANPVSRRWEELDEGRQRREIRRMQAYAGMVEALDANIGRLLDHLDAGGELDNTLVIFISDNGPEGNDPFVIAQNETYVPEHFSTDTDSLGRAGSFTAYGPGWAAVSATPFRLYKTFPSEGGIRVPAIFRLPGSRPGRSEPERAFATVLDIPSTILDYAGVTHPADAGTDTVLPMQGRSMRELLEGRASAVHGEDDAVGWELFGRRALRRGNWKILQIGPPYGDGSWKLYDLAADPLERHDLSEAEPEILATMLGHWDAYAENNNVLDYDYSNLQYGKVNEHYER